MIFCVLKEDRYKTGVYSIINTLNNKIYIGSTSNNFYNRFHQHISDYKVGKRDIRVLYRAFDKYGIKNFEFKIVCECVKEDCLKLEQFYINKGTDYNCAKIAGSLLGLKHLETAKTRMIKGGLHHCAKAVFQFSKSGEFIKKHGSIIEAINELKKSYKGKSHISQACIGNTFSAFGYRWSFENKLIIRPNRYGKHKILIKKDNIEKTFDSQISAAGYFKEMGYPTKSSSISNAITRNNKLYKYTIKRI